MKIKYIENDMQKGIEYDFDAISKVYKKLNCPPNVYNPTHVHNVCSGRWILDLSERSLGKTTNWILWGMCVRSLYPDFQIIYLRETSDMIMPKHSKQLFTTILQFDYISKVTNGKFNSVIYKSRCFYYFNGETGETDATPFFVMLALNENALNKSSFNSPCGDLILFDEFLSKYNYSYEFIDLCDTIKTIVRERFSSIIVLCANTINKHSFYYKELGIYDYIQHMEINSRREIITNGGTIVDVALLGHKMEDIPETKKKHNRTFFGFENPNLNAIRGGDWNVKIYPHITRESDTKILIQNIYIKHNSYYMNVRLCNNERYGLHLEVSHATKIYDDTIIMCLDTQLENRKHIFGWLTSKTGMFYKKLINEHKIFYATNYEGEMFENYIRECEMYA